MTDNGSIVFVIQYRRIASLLTLLRSAGCYRNIFVYLNPITDNLQITQDTVKIQFMECHSWYNGFYSILNSIRLLFGQTIALALVYFGNRYRYYYCIPSFSGLPGVFA